eukprot:TRINITY_DN3945_c0_g1_i1.p1 TRINITY_DN3945_c0_g1~~TRINITY_DN3945_c0_g1_i1.p1  ORF type:complete len:1376 (+),score=267.84 TRINITY_DN3945_c0_g1_i1:109-4236(+)
MGGSNGLTGKRGSSGTNGLRVDQVGTEANGSSARHRLLAALEHQDEEEVAEALEALQHSLNSSAVSDLVPQVRSLCDVAIQAARATAAMAGTVAAAALGYLGELAARLGGDCGSVADSLLLCCVERWADARVGVRGAATAALDAIAIRCFPSEKGSEAVAVSQLKALHTVVPAVATSGNWHVKEEGVNYVTHALLSARRDRVEHAVSAGLLIPLLGCALRDPKPRVEFAAVEACAVLHSIHQGTMTQWVEGLRGEGRADLHELLIERFAEASLPRLRSRGKVEHPVLSQPPPAPPTQPTVNRGQRKASVTEPTTPLPAGVPPNHRRRSPPTTETVRATGDCGSPLGMFVSDRRPKTPQSEDSSPRSATDGAPVALRDIVTARQPAAGAVRAFLTEQQRRQSGGGTGDVTVFDAKDMHKPGVTDEEKIRLWLPHSGQASLSGAQISAMRYAAKPSTASTAELELVSISSAASSTTRDHLQSAHAAAEARRRRPEPPTLTREALSPLTKSPGAPTNPQTAPGPPSTASTLFPPAPSTAGTQLGDSPSFGGSVGAPGCCDAASADKLALLRSKGRGAALAGGGRRRRWLQSADSSVVASADSSRASLATPNVFPLEPPLTSPPWGAQASGDGTAGRDDDSPRPAPSPPEGGAAGRRGRRGPPGLVQSTDSQPQPLTHAISAAPPAPAPLAGAVRRVSKETPLREEDPSIGVMVKSSVPAPQMQRAMPLRLVRQNSHETVDKPAPTAAPPANGPPVGGSGRGGWRTGSDRRPLRRPPEPDRRIAEREPVDLSLTVTSQSSGGRAVSPTTGKYRSLTDQAAKPQEEVPTEELEPLAAPERVLPDAMEGLKGTDWRKHFDALTTVRALCIHHPQVISANVQQITGALVRSAASLRSAITKHAMVAIADFVTHLQRRMDPYLSEPVGVLQQLLKRASEPNHFLAEEAERALHCVVAHCTPHRVLSALSPQLAHKSEKHRAKAAKTLHSAVTKLGPSTYDVRDISTILTCLHKLLSDSNFEVRHWARLSCSVLQQSGDFEKASLRAGLQQKQVQTMLDAAARARAHDDAVAATGGRDQLTRVNLTPSDAMPHPVQHMQGVRPAAKQRRSSVQQDVLGGTSGSLGPGLPALDDGKGRDDSPVDLRGSIGPKRSSFGGGLPASLEGMTAVASDVGDLDWKVRIVGLTRLRELVKQNELDARNDRASALLVDTLLQRCSDQNQKVCALALSVLAEVIPVVCPSQLVPPSLSRLVGTVAATLSSSVQPVVGEAQRVLGLLQEVADVATYLNQLALVLGNATNPRVKVVLLSRVYSLLQAVHAARPEVIPRHVLPPCLRLLSDPRADVRQENNRVMVKCHELLGDRIYEHTSGLAPAQAQKLQDLLED